MKSQLDWDLLDFPAHQGMQRLVRDLNRLYAGRAALHDLDFSHEGFAWLDCNDADHSVLSYKRIARNGSCLVVILNFTPVPRSHYRIGVPGSGTWREIFNSDSHHYGGTNMGNGEGLQAEEIPWTNEARSVSLTIPPLACIIIEN